MYSTIGLKSSFVNKATFTWILVYLWENDSIYHLAYMTINTTHIRHMYKLVAVSSRPNSRLSTPFIFWYAIYRKHPQGAGLLPCQNWTRRTRGRESTPKSTGMYCSSNQQKGNIQLNRRINKDVISKHLDINRSCSVCGLYWFIYRGPGFLAVVWFGSAPSPPPSRELIVEKTIDIFLEGQNWLLSKEIWVSQTNEQQSHFNEWPMSELPGEVDSIQTS
jgi:hypothetical protein